MKRFIHLTDIHFSSRDKTQNEIHFETRKTILNVIKEINNFRPEPNFILISGDLSNTGNIKSYEELYQIFQLKIRRGSCENSPDGTGNCGLY